jgi:hypothetical protein
MSHVFKDPGTYSGEFVCICCGSGWPCCADKKPDGTNYTHAETCNKYHWGGDKYDVCERCEREIEIERRDDPA